MCQRRRFVRCGMKKSLSTAVVLLLLLAGVSAERIAEAQGALDSSAFEEYELKAEFLERFTRFIKWPDGHRSGPAVRFVIGITGIDPFGDNLERRARRWLIQGRQVEIRRVHPDDDLRGIDMLFISSSEKGRLEQILEQAAVLPILTVGDTAGYGGRGVIINFYLEEDTVHFEINQQAVGLSGLEVSSRLLKNARLVGPGIEGAPSSHSNQP